MSFELCGHSPIKMSSNRRLADEDLVSINFVKEMITGLFVGSQRVFRAINGQRKLSKHIGVLWSFFLNHTKLSNPCDLWRSKRNLLIKLSAEKYSRVSDTDIKQVIVWLFFSCQLANEKLGICLQCDKLSVQLSKLCQEKIKNLWISCSSTTKFKSFQGMTKKVSYAVFQALFYEYCLSTCYWYYLQFSLSCIILKCC